MRFLAALATALLAATVGSAGATGLRRPLHFPKAAAACPVTKTERVGRQVFSVAGPVRLEAVGVPPRSGVIDVSQPGASVGAWRAQKTPWVLPSAYRGPVLIRARRLDRTGSVRFGKVYGQHLAELLFRRGESNGSAMKIPGLSGHYRLLASDSQFRADGCYGFQIDGTSFSAVIVVRVKG